MAHPPSSEPPPAVTHTGSSSTGSGPATMAVVLGALGCVAPLLPFDLTGVRPYVGLPFAVAGLILAVVGLGKPRRGKPVAAAGVVLSVLALLLGIYMIAAHGVPTMAG